MIHSARVVAVLFVVFFAARVAEACNYQPDPYGPICRSVRPNIASRGYDPATGAFVEQTTDLRLPGKSIDFVLTRTYRSKNGPHDLANDTFGPYYPAMDPAMPYPTNCVGWNWDHSYNMSVFGRVEYDEHDQASTPIIYLRDGTGRLEKFMPLLEPGQAPCDATDFANAPLFFDAFETPARPAVFRRVAGAVPVQGQPGVFATGFVLTYSDGMKYYFYADESVPSGIPACNPVLPPSNLRGKLQRVEAADGEFISLTYDLNSGRLTSVTDTLNAVITFEYYPNSAQLHRVKYLAGALPTPVEEEIEYSYFTVANQATGNVGDLARVKLPSTPSDPDGSTVDYSYSKGAEIITETNLVAIAIDGTPIVENVYNTTAYNPYVLNLELDGLYYDTLVEQTIDDELRTFGFSEGGVLGINEYANVILAIDGNNHLTRYAYDSLNRIVEERRYTGQVLPGIRDLLRDHDRTQDIDPETNYVWGGQPTNIPVIDPLLASRPGVDPAVYITKYVYTGGSIVEKQTTYLPSTAGDINSGDGMAIEEQFAVVKDDPREQGSRTARIHRRNFETENVWENHPYRRETWTYIGGFGGPGCGCSGGVPETYTDAMGRVTSYEYDSTGRVESVTYPTVTVGVIGGGSQASSESFTYLDGQLETLTMPLDSNGVARIDKNVYYPSNHQSAGRLHQSVVDFGDSSKLNLTTTYEYDATGNVIRVVDPRGNDALSFYDETNRLIREESALYDPDDNPGTNNSIRFWKEYIYNGRGQLVREDVGNYGPDGSAVVSNPKITTIREYDAADRVFRVFQEIGILGMDIADTQIDGTGLIDNDRWAVMEFGYDGNGNQVLAKKGESSDGRQPGNKTTRVFDERNKIFTETIGEGSTATTTRFDYNLNGNLTKRIEGYGSISERVFTYEYDTFDRIIRITDPQLNTTEYTYDLNGNKLTEEFRGELIDTNQTANVLLSRTTFVYDERNRLVETKRTKIDSPPSDTVVSSKTYYAPDSSVIKTVDPRGNETYFTYDTAGRRTVTTDAMGNTATVQLDANGNTTRTTSYELSDTPGRAAITWTMDQVFDALNRAISQTDSRTNQSAFRYDSRGKVVEVTDPRSNLTTMEYDGLGRLVRTTRHTTVPIVTQQVWDDSNRLIAQIDGNGPPTGAGPNVTRYGYDDHDRLIIKRMADGTLQKVGDGGSWPEGDDYPTLTGFATGYDVHGNAAYTTDANGNLVTTVFDLNRRPIERTIVRGAGIIGTSAESYLYDGAGRIREAEDDDSQVQREYDLLGRMSSETLFINPGQSDEAEYETTYVHDEAGNATTVVYPSGRVVVRTFDDLNRTQTISSTPIGGGTQVHLAAYEYGGRARVDRRLIGAAPNRLISDFIYTGFVGEPHGFGDDQYGYMRLASSRHFNEASPSIAFDLWSYKWDKAQNKSARTDGFAGGGQRKMNYDAANRLVSAGGTFYNLDPVHNRTTVSGSVSGGAQIGTYTRLDGSPPIDDEPVNQYTETPSDLPAYDENGNLTFIGPQSGQGMMMGLGLGSQAGNPPLEEAIENDISTGGLYADVTSNASFDAEDVGVVGQALTGGNGPLDGGGEWQGLARLAVLRYDYRNQMVEYEDQDAGRLHRFGYDCFGRRISKVTDADCVAFSTRVHHYVNGGQMMWQVLEEYESVPPCPCGGEGEDPCPPTALAASFVYGNYIDEPISVRRDVVAPSGVEDYYFFADDLANLTCLTDASGSVVERYRYGDYGTPTIRTPGGTELYESAYGNARLWNGREFDREINFYHYRTRYLEPTWGRFTTRDTIGIWGDSANHGNGYAYVGNDPWSHVDPSARARTRFMFADAVFLTGAWSFGADVFDLVLPLFPINVSLQGSVGLEMVAHCRSRQVGFFLTFGIGGEGSVGTNNVPVSTDISVGLGVAWNSRSLQSWGGPGVSGGVRFPSNTPYPGYFRGWQGFVDGEGAFGFVRTLGVSSGTEVALNFGFSYSAGPFGDRPMSPLLFRAICTDAGPECQGTATSSATADDTVRELKNYIDGESHRLEQDLLFGSETPAQFYATAFLLEVLDALRN